jgi:hypothetical protein
MVIIFVNSLSSFEAWKISVDDTYNLMYELSSEGTENWRTVPGVAISTYSDILAFTGLPILSATVTNMLSASLNMMTLYSL